MEMERSRFASYRRIVARGRHITLTLHPLKIQPQSPDPRDPILYKQRHRIENMFGRLTDWRRVHTRYDRCAHAYFSAICIAAAVIFWL